jgi:hypothetical protein
MQKPLGQHILKQLSVVETLRKHQGSDPQHRARVLAIKAYQAERFRRAYPDLLNDRNYRQAATFFLDELYGPQDFADRDHQFARVVPSMVRVFPEELIGTVAKLSDLHALSETLDDRMASELASSELDAASYIQAWQRASQPRERTEQINHTIDIGRDLERYTRSRWIRTTLRLMRKPAQAAGLGALQHFLETGFDAFAGMRQVDRFLATIQNRETALAEAMFGATLASRPEPNGGPTLVRELDSPLRVLP